MKHRTIRKVMILTFIILLGGAGVYWFLIKSDPQPEIPMNLPTAEEEERMRDIVRSSNQVAPGAQPGIGVLPPGSTPLVELEEGDSTVEVGVEAELVEETPED